jgi:hypothetical protein
MWGHLTGHTPHPSVPICPNEPNTGADGTPSSDEAQADYTAASEQHMFDLSDYEDWVVDKARAAQIVLGSMQVEFAMDLASLHSSDMGACNRALPI